MKMERKCGEFVHSRQKTKERTYELLSLEERVGDELTSSDGSRHD